MPRKNYVGEVVNAEVTEMSPAVQFATDARGEAGGNPLFPLRHIILKDSSLIQRTAVNVTRRSESAIC